MSQHPRTLRLKLDSARSAMCCDVIVFWVLFTFSFLALYFLRGAGGLPLVYTSL